MDETDEDSKICSHCKKKVALSNFILHESHCHRFLSFCPDCNETVPQEQMEEHRSEQHTLVRCTKCSKKVERCHLEDHKLEECEGRMQLCKFCQLEMPFRDLDEHTVTCGSRTEHCGDCGRYVQLRDQKNHALQCSPVPREENRQDTAVHSQKQKSTLQLCFNCMKTYPLDQMWQHQQNCSVSSPPGDDKDDVNQQDPQNANFLSFTFSQRESKTLVKRDLEDMDQIDTCLYCHLALPLTTLQWHKVKCKAFERLKKKNELKKHYR
ncbi:XIAP-associated factor 1 isoform X2 [Arapaima gigas]